MEVDRRQEFEMAEGGISPKVYDILHPTPLSLKELSAIAISLEIWRREVIKYRESKTLESFDPQFLIITSLGSSLSDVPSTICKISNDYQIRFALSLSSWLEYHTGLSFDYGRCNNILEDFDDFVCDYDGAVDFAKTAERMLRCSGFSDAMKFNIACTYCLEDDIRRMWPSVSNSIAIDSIDFNKYPHMYYWICRLTNQLDNIVPTGVNETVDEEMFDRHHRDNIPSLAYFWNGLSRENQMQQAIVICKYDEKSFLRIILPRLDDQQLDEFVNERCRWLMTSMLWKHRDDEGVVLNTWSYIRNVLNVNTFKNHFFGWGMLSDIECGTEDESYNRSDNPYGRRDNDHLNLCVKIWNSVPDSWKQSVIRDLLSGTSLLRNFCQSSNSDITQINVELLLFILRRASFEEMNSFWHNSWHLLIRNSRSQYLQRMMNVCFENEHQMDEFKRNTLATSENVRQLCVGILSAGKYFDYLTDLVSFIHPEKQNQRNFKQQLLRSCFLAEQCLCDSVMICRFEKFIDFVTDAYDTVDLSSDFRTQLMSSPSFLNRVWHFINIKKIAPEVLLKFFDAIVSTKEIKVQIKMTVAESLKQFVTDDAHRRGLDCITCEGHFSWILFWCLELPYDKVEKFFCDE